MVLCLDIVDIEMYNPMSNRPGAAVQNFAALHHAGHYAAAGFAATHHHHGGHVASVMHGHQQQQQQLASSQFVSSAATSSPEINCPVAAQYHQMAEVHQGLMQHQQQLQQHQVHQHQVHHQQQQQQQHQQQQQQQQQHQQQQTIMQGGSGGWPSAMSYSSLSSCARTVGHGHMTFEEWTQAGCQPVQQQLPPSASSPNSTVSLSPPHHVPSCHYATVSDRQSYVTKASGLTVTTANLSASSTRGGGGASASAGGDYSTSGHHSPADSGLTASSCSDGLSSAGSPHQQQQQQSASSSTTAAAGGAGQLQQQQASTASGASVVKQQNLMHAAVTHPLPFHHHAHHHHHLGHGTAASGSAAAAAAAALVQQVTASNRPAPVRSPFEWMKSKSSAYQNQPNPGKTRTKDKYRVVYSDHQRLELEKEFHYSRYITIRRKAELAQMLGLSERQVKIWFQNRRAKERKQGKKRDDLKPTKEPPQLPLSMPSSAANVVLQHGHHATTAQLLHHHHHHHHLQASNALMTTAQSTKVIHLD